jgi:hypothetical protein
MRSFHCGNCDQLVFFENTSCVHCGHALAYLPDESVLGTFAPPTDGEPRLVGPKTVRRAYRFCANYGEEGLCNWAVPADHPNSYCLSCRLTRIYPDLRLPGSREGWIRLEAAKRRLIYTLLCLNLPLANKAEDPERGLAFEFLADPLPGTPGAAPVLTGHQDGIITISVTEADDVERQRRRRELNEPYRTILGHFRHESGHYYWDRLIRDSKTIDDVRQLFGDERADYNEAIQRHHQQGAPADWPDSFVSAYASAHPWEDWAESWAHYLHIVDTLEMAISCGLALRPGRPDEPAMKPDITMFGHHRPSFDQLIVHWLPLTYVLNNLNRGMGLQDAYPFVLPPRALDKLRFIHDLVGEPRCVSRPSASAGS